MLLLSVLIALIAGFTKLFSLIARERTITNIAAQFERVIKRYWAIFLTLAIWTIICPMMIADWQFDSQLYNSVATYDWVKNVAIVDGIKLSGAPPQNLFTCADGIISFFYYYFWHIVPGVISASIPIHSLTNALPVSIAVAIWTGYGFIANLIVLCQVMYKEQCDSKLLQTVVPMISVSGLLGLPIFLLLIVTGKLHALPDINWLCDQQIGGLIDDLLWIPHHINGLIAGITASLLLREQVLHRFSAWRAIVVAAGFATSFGSSVYVSVPIAMSFLFWLLFCLIKGRRKEAFQIVIGGLSGVLLLLPFLLELQSHHMQPQLFLGIANFHFLDFDLSGFCRSPLARSVSTILLLEPLRFLIFCGPFFVLAIYYWCKKMGTKTDWQALPLCASCLLITTFVHSTAHNDDMGWRALLPLLIFMLIWSARFISSVYFQHRTTRIIITMLLLLGLFTEIFNLYLVRSYSFFNFNGKETFACRDIYNKVNAVVPKTARLQANPEANFFGLAPYVTLYGHHQTVVVDKINSIIFGGNADIYRRTLSDITPVFKNASIEQVRKVCKKYKIDAVIVKKEDPAWQDPTSWVNQNQPDFQNDYFKAFMTSTW